MIIKEIAPDHKRKVSVKISKLALIPNFYFVYPVRSLSYFCVACLLCLKNALVLKIYR